MCRAAIVGTPTLCAIGCALTTLFRFQGLMLKAIWSFCWSHINAMCAIVVDEHAYVSCLLKCITLHPLPSGER